MGASGIPAFDDGMFRLNLDPDVSVKQVQAGAGGGRQKPAAVDRSQQALAAGPSARSQEHAKPNGLREFQYLHVKSRQPYATFRRRG